MPREQFHQQLETLQDSTLEMGSMVDEAIERAMHALVDRDADVAREVIAGDTEIDRAGFHLQNMCISLLAQQAPMATDLRVIISVTAIASELERIGDHAEGIARIVLLMQNEPLVKPLVDIPLMAQRAREMLQGAMRSFVDLDETAARNIPRLDDEVDRLYDVVYGDLVQIMIRDPSTVEPCTHLLWVAHNLERIADRSTNIAERTVFAVTGMLSKMNISSY